MNILDLFAAVSTHLIELMGVGLCIALILRFIAFKSGKRNLVYFRTLSRSVEKNLEKPENQPGSMKEIDSWFSQLMDVVKTELPSRSLRMSGGSKAGEGSFRTQGKKTLSEFMTTKRDILYNISNQMNALRSPFPPDFKELSTRVLNQDPFWKNIVIIVPVDTLQRILGIMPGLFIIGGIFGTFIGITAALPMIATIDLSDLDAAGPILNQFVANIAYSMKTSIAGIIYSVILTLLNTLFPLASVRIEIREGLARTFEHIWTRIHKDKLTPGEQEIVSSVGKLCDVLEKNFSGKKVS